MKSSLKNVPMVVGVLCVGAVAQATDFTWDGGNYTNDGWTRPANWVQDSGYPDDTGDNATIADVTPHSTCTFDDSTERSIKNLEVTGDSPTWMRLHVKDAALNVRGDMTLGDYGELDIDQDMEVHDDLVCATPIPTAELRVQGRGRVNVAANKVFLVDEVIADGSNAILNVTNAGDFKIHFIGVDADFDNADRALKLVGGTLKFDTGCDFWHHQILITSDPGGLGQGKLWVASTTLDFGTVHSTSVYFEGGDDAGEEVEIDLDVDMTVGQIGSFVSCTGLVEIDIAAGKTFTMNRLVVGDSAGASVTTLTAGAGAKIVVPE